MRTARVVIVMLWIVVVTCLVTISIARGEALIPRMRREVDASFGTTGMLVYKGRELGGQVPRRSIVVAAFSPLGDVAGVVLTRQADVLCRFYGRFDAQGCLQLAGCLHGHSCPSQVPE